MPTEHTAASEGQSLDTESSKVIKDSINFLFFHVSFKKKPQKLQSNKKIQNPNLPTITTRVLPLSRELPAPASMVTGCRGCSQAAQLVRTLPRHRSSALTVHPRSWSRSPRLNRRESTSGSWRQDREAGSCFVTRLNGLRGTARNWQKYSAHFFFPQIAPQTPSEAWETGEVEPGRLITHSVQVNNCDVTTETFKNSLD